MNNTDKLKTILGVILLVLAIFVVFPLSVKGAILWIIAGIILTPDTLAIIERILKNKLKKPLKYTVFFVSFLLGFIFMMNASVENDRQKKEAFDKLPQHVKDSIKLADELKEKNERIAKVKKKTTMQYATYKILRIEPFESRRKAQVKCYAYLTTDTISEDKLSATLTRLYGDMRGYNKFKNYNEPNYFAIYLFTSKEMATTMSGSWIAMLSKYPQDDVPTKRFDDQKIKALVESLDNVKTDQEKKYDELNEYFEKRNTTLCFIYKELYDLEVYSIKQADIKYPDFGIEHSKYVEDLYHQEKKKLFKKYNIADSVSSKIIGYGMTYCK